MAAAKYVDQRKNVMVGNLPEDFLRVDSPSNGSVSPSADSYSNTQALQYQPTPNNAASQITLCIVQAQLAKNYSLTKMDPYVRVRIGHTVYETHADARGGKFPNWNKTIIAYLPHGIKSIHIDIFDEHTITADERIAFAEYFIPDEAFQGKFIDTWISLNGRQGEGKEGSINITLSISSCRNPVFTPPQNMPYMMPAASPIMVVPQPIIGPLPYYSSGNYASRSTRPVVQYPMVQPVMNPAYVYPTVQQQPCRAPISEEEIKQLQEMFPSFDKEVIVGVLESSGGNKEHAISALLAMSEK